MKSTTKEKLVTAFPCLMKDQFGRVVLVTDLSNKPGRYQVTVVAAIKAEIANLGTSWESDLKPTEYFPLPSGFEVNLIN